MLLSRTLIKKSDSSSSIENPFLVSYRFLYYVPKKNCKSFFRLNHLPLVGVFFSHFLSHQLWQKVLKKAMKFLIFEQIRVCD